MSRNHRKSKKRWLFPLILAAAIVAAFFLLRCTGTFGLGGSGDDTDPTEQQTSDTTPRGAVSSGDAASPPSRCLVRLDSTGLSVDGQPAELAAAVATCKRAGKAELTVTGETKFGLLEDVENALKAAGIKVIK